MPAPTLAAPFAPLVRALLAAWAALLLAGAPPAHAAGLACTLAGAAGAAVTLRGQALTLPASPPDCTGAQVSAGTVAACIEDRLGRAVCREFTRGTRLDAAAFQTPQGTGLLDSLGALLRGGTGMATAQSRGEATGALPEGTVLLLDGALTLDFNTGPLRDADAVEIRATAADGPLVARLGRPPEAATLARARLQAGPIYWALPMGLKTALLPPSRFVLATPPEVAQARREMARIEADRAAGPTARALMRAHWLQREHYTFEAHRALKASGLVQP